MRRVSTVVFALAVVIAISTRGHADEGDHPGIAGTYWTSIEGVFPTPLPAVLSFTSDGRIVAIEGQGPETSGLGSWEARGSRSVAGAFIFFLALIPADAPDGGRYSLIGRIDFAGGFDDHFESATLPFTANVFAAGQNPLVDTPLLSAKGTMIATRLNVRGR